MIRYDLLPTLNASLNALSAILLVIGLVCIKTHRIRAHTICMSAAFVTSLLFLTSYVLYHVHVGSQPFPGQGWVRPCYFTLLISHTVLAIVIVPLALRTLYLAIRGRFAQHEAIARWTLPLWLYVSVTGVIIYWILYRVRWET